MTAHELLTLMDTMSSDPLRAADLLDQMADKLRAKAAELRQQADKCKGGTSDRVQMTLRGPNGEIKQTVDTGANQS